MNVPIIRIRAAVQLFACLELFITRLHKPPSHLFGGVVLAKQGGFAGGGVFLSGPV